MERDSSKRGWLAAATIVAFAAAPHLWATLELPDARDSVRLTAWWVLYAVFVASFAATAWWALPRQRTWPVVALLALQTLAALGANWLVPTVIAGVATGGALLVVVASQLARLPAVVATAWVLVQHAVLLAIYLRAWPTPIALVAGIAFAVFSFVVLAMERLSLRERGLRVELGRTLAELTAARQSLEARARDSERLRIARDLHDVLGHHLVALSLQLQLAERAEPDQSRASVARASALTRLLLGDLRAVVADMREQRPPQLFDALGSLAEREASPRITVHTPPTGRAPEGIVAETLLRAAQELVTNARKHSRGTEVFVELVEGELRVEDNGAGGPITPGTGLKGLRERLDAIGGSLIIEHPERGTRARVLFPDAPPPEVAP